jgi:hypothetical protein
MQTKTRVLSNNSAKQKGNTAYTCHKFVNYS